MMVSGSAGSIAGRFSCAIRMWERRLILRQGREAAGQTKPAR
ncbi:hypothetical protein SFOMI_0774 [Sphingobium fuliginis]|uniref:Uncharacterized protein n=1 Tax=Sphingobium fuliginis (strain ATCC 27551) TaxID=336203 RepID=A0A292ZBI6_SPHSA|nr:hypothetical protein SFOMI_0774 [Sphingobium fuliginis]